MTGWVSCRCRCGWAKKKPTGHPCASLELPVAHLEYICWKDLFGIEVIGRGWSIWIPLFTHPYCPNAWGCQRQLSTSSPVEPTKAAFRQWIWCPTGAHCELVLGSLISHSCTDTFGKIYDKYKVILDELKVRHSILSTTKSFSSLMQQGTGSCIGVYRRFCPVCP